MATKTKIGDIDPEDPNNKKETDAVSIDMNVQEFSSEYSGIETTDDVTNKTIYYLERMVRNSYEYREYINYLKTELDITKCALTPNLDIKELDFKLEIHHYPITLYDICETILNKKLQTKKENETISMFDIMSDVMKEHFDGNIGLVPLSETAHQMAHNNSVKIPATAINGNYDRFTTKYKKYISQEILEKVQDAKLISEADAKEFNEKLNKNILNYNISYHKDDDDEEELD